MGYRRSITTRAKVLYQQRFSPSYGYIHHGDDRRRNSVSEDPKSLNFLQHRSFGSSFNTSSGLSALFRATKCSQFFVPMNTGTLLSRNMSITVGEGADKIDYMTDVAEVLADNTVEAVTSQAPAISEVAIAAADSYFPVAALQYVIDYVHSFTGFNWWASIVVTTLLIRGLTVPLMINQLKATSKLTLMRPHLEEIKQDMQNRGMSPTAVTEGQQQMAQLFRDANCRLIMQQHRGFPVQLSLPHPFVFLLKLCRFYLLRLWYCRYGVTPWTPLKGLLFQGPVFVSFFLAISNMVEKVPSFKEGGAFWFTDLTTPDSLYIFPVLTALTFWITVECNMQEGMEGNPAASTMKKVSRVFAALSVPLTMGFPKAIFCYWVTSNLFSLMYGLVIKKSGVKKFLGVPIIPVAPALPATTEPQSALSFFETLQKFVAASVAAQKAPSSPMEASKHASQRISSSSVLSQRLKSLEKEVKGRKKGKKR